MQVSSTFSPTTTTITVRGEAMSDGMQSTCLAEVKELTLNLTDPVTASKRDSCVAWTVESDHAKALMTAIVAALYKCEWTLSASDSETFFESLWREEVCTMSLHDPENFLNCRDAERWENVPAPRPPVVVAAPLPPTLPVWALDHSPPRSEWSPTNNVVGNPLARAPPPALVRMLPQPVRNVRSGTLPPTQGPKLTTPTVMSSSFSAPDKDASPPKTKDTSPPNVGPPIKSRFAALLESDSDDDLPHTSFVRSPQTQPRVVRPNEFSPTNPSRPAIPQMFTPPQQRDALAFVPQRAMPLTTPPSGSFSSPDNGPEFLEGSRGDFINLALLGHASGPGMEVSKRRYVGPRPKRSESDMSVTPSVNANVTASTTSDQDELWNAL